MTDEKTGYRKPPRHTQFKPGNRTNPLGRGAKKQSKHFDVVKRLLHTPQAVLARGKSRKITRLGAMVNGIGENALRGDIESARLLLQLRKHSTAAEDFVPVIFIIDEMDDLV